MENTSEQGKKKGSWGIIGLVGIIIVIIVIAAIALGGGTKKKVTQAFTDMGSISDALESYHTTNNMYPQTLDDLVTSGCIDKIANDSFNSGNQYRYYVNDITSATCYLLVSNGPDGDADVTAVTDWTTPVSGKLGGPDGASEGYGATWSDGKSKDSDGDIGMGGSAVPAAPVESPVESPIE